MRPEGYYGQAPTGYGQVARAPGPESRFAAAATWDAGKGVGKGMTAPGPMPAPRPMAPMSAPGSFDTGKGGGKGMPPRAPMQYTSAPVTAGYPQAAQVGRPQAPQSTPGLEYHSATWPAGQMGDWNQSAPAYQQNQPPAYQQQNSYNRWWPAATSEATPLKATGDKWKKGPTQITDRYEKQLRKIEDKKEKQRRNRKRYDGVRCNDLCTPLGRICFAWFCAFSCVPGAFMLMSAAICWGGMKPKPETTTSTTSFYPHPDNATDDWGIPSIPPGRADTGWPVSETCSRTTQCNATCFSTRHFTPAGTPKASPHSCECPIHWGSRRRNSVCCNALEVDGYSYVPATFCGSTMRNKVTVCKIDSAGDATQDCSKYDTKPDVNYLSLLGTLGDNVRYYMKRSLEQTTMFILQDYMDKTMYQNVLKTSGALKLAGIVNLLDCEMGFKGYMRGWIPFGHSSSIMEQFENMNYMMTITNGLDMISFKTSQPVPLKSFIKWDGRMSLGWKSFGKKWADTSYHDFFGNMEPDLLLHGEFSIPDGGLLLTRDCSLECPIGAALHYVDIKFWGDVRDQNLKMKFTLDCNDDKMCNKVKSKIESEDGQETGYNNFKATMQRMMDTQAARFQKRAVEKARPILSDMKIYMWHACYACFWIGGCDGMRVRSAALRLNYLFVFTIVYMVFLTINLFVCGCCCVMFWRQKTRDRTETE